MACHTCGSISCCAGRDDDAPRVETWTPEHEVSRWRALVAALVFAQRAYGYDHKRTWDAIDNLDDALSGFDAKRHDLTLKAVK